VTYLGMSGGNLVDLAARINAKTRGGRSPYEDTDRSNAWTQRGLNPLDWMFAGGTAHAIYPS